MRYSFFKTAVKAGTPVLIIPLAFAIVAGLEMVGVEIAEDKALEISVALYGVFVGLKNWLKNRKR